MIEAQTLSYEDGEVEKELTYEVSKEVIVSTKVSFKKSDVLASLMTEIQNLKKEINCLKNDKLLVTEESLVKLWDNEHDDKWNHC